MTVSVTNIQHKYFAQLAIVIRHFIKLIEMKDPKITKYQNINKKKIYLK